MKWRCTRHADRVELALRSMAITIYPRVVDTDPASWRGAAVRTIRTSEDEYVDLVVTHHDVKARIEGDDYDAVIEGSAGHVEERPEVHGAVLEIASHYPLGLGRERVRRVRHEGPRGWEPTFERLATRWQAPDGSSIHVLPARPLSEPPHVHQLACTIHDERFDDFSIEQRDQVGLVIGAFRGVVVRSIGTHLAEPRCYLTAGFTDARFRYVVRLSQPAGSSHQRAYLELVQSCESLAPKVATKAHSIAHVVD